MFAKRTNWNLQRNSLSEALAAYCLSGKPPIDLTCSNPTDCGFRFNEALLLAALNNRAALHYDPDPRGLSSARKSVARYYHSLHSEISLDDIFLTTSTSEAYSFLFRMLCDPGDEVLIPQPGYPLFDFLAGIQDVNPVRYPLVYDYGWQIDFHALEQAITSHTRAVVVVHPNNPTGHFCKPAEIKQLNEICVARNIAIISDEVFFDFALDLSTNNGTLQSFASNVGALTFTLSGISKISGLPQMKVAWLIASGPQALKTEALSRLEIIADTYLSMNAPVQLALNVFLEQRHTFREQWLLRVQNNLAHLDKLVASEQICRRLKVEGGWYAVLKVSGTESDDDLALELLRTRGVYVHPGHFYDFPANGYLVLSLITPEEEFAAGTSALLETLQTRAIQHRS